MKILKQFILREIAGDYVLVPTGETAREFNGMVTLNPSAAFIWQHYEHTASLEELLALLLEEFDTDEATARADLITFTSELVQRGILAPQKEDGTW